MQQGKITFLVARYDAHSIRRTLPQDNNLLCPINNVVISYDIAISSYEESRSIAHIARLAVPGLFRQILNIIKLDVSRQYSTRNRVSCRRIHYQSSCC